jgi:hypothetical protein
VESVKLVKSVADHGCAERLTLAFVVGYWTNHAGTWPKITGISSDDDTAHKPTWDSAHPKLDHEIMVEIPRANAFETVHINVKTDTAGSKSSSVPTLPRTTQVEGLWATGQLSQLLIDACRRGFQPHGLYHMRDKYRVTLEYVGKKVEHELTTASPDGLTSLRNQFPDWRFDYIQSTGSDKYYIVRSSTTSEAAEPTTGIM